MRINKHISVVIKVTNACNLNCRYCYDANNEAKKLISIYDIENLLVLLGESYSSVQLIWHGGEPMLMGMDFYKCILHMQEKSFPNIKFDNHIQTNGTLIDNQWAEFFVNNKFKVGVSYDGGNERSGRLFQKESFRGRNFIKEHGGSCGVLNVVDKFNINDLIELYTYYKKHGISVQFNYVFPAGRITQNRDLLLTPSEYISKMCQLFDYWLFDTTCNISVEPLIGYIRLLCGYNTKCTTEGCMYKWLCFDYNGDLYPCGRIVNKEYKLGNIRNIESINDLFYVDSFVSLLESSISRRNKCINSCKLFKYCKGGCNSDAILYGDISANGHNACLIFKGIMNHIISKLEEVDKNFNLPLNPYVKKYIYSLQDI